MRCAGAITAGTFVESVWAVSDKPNVNEKAARKIFFIRSEDGKIGVLVRVGSLSQRKNAGRMLIQAVTRLAKATLKINRLRTDYQQDEVNSGGNSTRKRKSPTMPDFS